MKRRSETPPEGVSVPASDQADYGIADLLGLGRQSVRKNYYPALQERIDELEQERNRYKWLFENALHGIFQANLRGGFIAANPAMAESVATTALRPLSVR